MKEHDQNCPCGHGEMELKKTKQRVTFRDLDLDCTISQYVCGHCGLEVASVKQAAQAQKDIADVYRAKKGLMTGAEIKGKRKELSMTQKDLADAMSVGIASIKRWEGGIIQTPGMDKLLRQAFWPRERDVILTGNRRFSLERTKLVLAEFDMLYKHDLFAEGDRLLYTAKPLWYADMIAHRELGRSMTGSTYAALPKGPQLNNYSELIDDIKQSDASKAEPLSTEEKKIIKRVYEKFPGKTDAYHASHKEIIWQNKRSGEIIPYADSAELSEL